MVRWYELSDDDFDERVLGAAEPVLVEFWAPWCGPCRRTVPIVVEVVDKLEGQLHHFKVNTDENDRLPERWDVASIPTFLLFYEGREVARWNGQQGARTMRGEMKGIIASL